MDTAKVKQLLAELYAEASKFPGFLNCNFNCNNGYASFTVSGKDPDDPNVTVTKSLTIPTQGASS